MAVNPSTNLSSDPSAPAWAATPCPPDTMLRLRRVVKNLTDHRLLPGQHCFGGYGGCSSGQTTELKFVDGWMSHRHVGHMTLMPQSQHSIAGMLVQALEVASRSLGIDTMSMARFTPFSRGKIVGKAEEGAPRNRIRTQVLRVFRDFQEAASRRVKTL